MALATFQTNRVLGKAHGEFGSGGALVHDGLSLDVMSSRVFCRDLLAMSRIYCNLWGEKSKSGVSVISARGNIRGRRGVACAVFGNGKERTAK